MSCKLICQAAKLLIHRPIASPIEGISSNAATDVEIRLVVGLRVDDTCPNNYDATQEQLNCSTIFSIMMLVFVIVLHV